MTRQHPLPLAALLLGLATCLCTLLQCGQQPARSQPSAALASATPVAAESGPEQDPNPTIVPERDQLRLLVSASMSGRLEPCGCASGQLGGLARRMQHIGERHNYDLLLEGGNLVEGSSPLDLEKLLTAVTILANMQHPYDAMGIGQHDLELPFDDWVGYSAGAPFVASDLTSEQAEWPGKPYVEKKVRGRAVRIASLTLAVPGKYQGEDSKVRLLAPLAGWTRALEGADEDAWRILLLHGTDVRARELVPTLQPPPHLVVCCDASYVEPSTRPEMVAGIPVVYPGTRGRILLECTLYRLPKGPRAALEVVPLAGSLTVPGGGGDPDVKQVLLAHRNQVKEDGLLQRMARQQPTPNGASYVGSQNCQSCHITAYAAWQASKHAHAWETLQKAEADPKRYGWPVTAYPDCVSCHVVGYREQSGFVSFEDTPQLAGVGCERCHGPGSEHIASGGKVRLGMHGGTQASVLCVQCHDFEQSPTFVYGERWPTIAHKLDPK